MKPMNPYAKFLGNRNPQEVIAETPGQLSAIAEKLGPAGMDRSLGPGKWPARAIYCHLADCELAFAFRYRQALAENDHVIQPFDQDAWAKQYESLDAESAMAAFVALRLWNLALLKSVTPEQYEKKLTHPERGEMTFRVVVETMAGHDLNHLRQLETIASQPAK